MGKVDFVAKQQVIPKEVQDALNAIDINEIIKPDPETAAALKRIHDIHHPCWAYCPCCGRNHP